MITTDLLIYLSATDSSARRWQTRASQVKNQYFGDINININDYRKYGLLRIE